MRTIAIAGAWILAYLALVSIPLLVLLVGPVPGGSGFWWDFSMAVGFAGLAIMGLQFALTARFRRATAPFGIDIIYYFHRWMAVGGVGLLLIHYAVVRLSHPAALGPLDPSRAAPHMTAGRVALVLFAFITASSLWRKRVRLEYDRWRILHAVLSVLAILLAVTHIEGAGYYTNAPWKRILWGGYSVSWVLLVVHVRLVKPWLMLKKPWRITGVQPERARAWTLTLEPVDHGGLRFSPGQFAWLTLRKSPFRAKEHPFSFSSSAADEGHLRFTVKELGDFTRLIGTTRIGEIAWVDGPHGVFTVDRYPDAPGFVFIAGGVGIAPIMSMLRTLADRGDARPLILVDANNGWKDVMFREELEALGSRLQLEVVHVLLDPPDGWTGRTGFVTESILRDALPPEPRGLVFFLCGPGPMSEAVQRALRNLGVPARRIHFELFDMV